MTIRPSMRVLREDRARAVAHRRARGIPCSAPSRGSCRPRAGCPRSSVGLERDERILEQAAVAPLDPEDLGAAARGRRAPRRGSPRSCPGASPPLVRIAIRLQPAIGDATLARPAGRLRLARVRRWSASSDDGPVTIVVLDRAGGEERGRSRDRRGARRRVPRVRRATPRRSVAVLTGDHGTFCAGADLKAIVAGPARNRVAPDGDGPMGPTRMLLDKPVIAAIAGHAVAGGLELALWCDLRVAEADAILGVFCRRFGVPLIDGGTIRLPRLIGLSRALDLILTGRARRRGRGARDGPGQSRRARAARRAPRPTRSRTSSRRCRRPRCCGDRMSAYVQHDLELVGRAAARARASDRTRSPRVWRARSASPVARQTWPESRTMKVVAAARLSCSR